MRALLLSLLVPAAAFAQPTINLPISYRDFRAFGQTANPDAGLPAGFPDMQRSFGGGVTTGIVANDVGPDGRPRLNLTRMGNVPLAGCGNTINVPTTNTCAQGNFPQWYRPSPSNTQVADRLTLTETPTGSGTYLFRSNAFFPLTGRGFGADVTTTQNRNFHFTSEIRAWFLYQGNESFTFSGDDDVWVFLNGRLAVDIGGEHGPATRSVNVATFFAGLPANQRCVVGGRCAISIFQAERQTTGSNFEINTTILFDDADPDGDGVPFYADNCPNVANASQSDIDGDSVGDACDNCPTFTNLDQTDTNGDGTGDACTGLTPLTPPVITGPANGTTTGGQPTITGTATPNTRVVVVLAGQELCTVDVGAAGTFACVPGTPLPAGSYSVVARTLAYNATTGTTQVSGDSNQPTFTVGGVLPPVVSTPPDGTRVQARPTYSGTATPGATVRVFVDGSSTAACTTTASATGAWSCQQPTNLPEGDHFVEARAQVGNTTSPVSNRNDFVVDTTAPATPTLTTPAANAMNVSPTPTYTGTAEANSVVTVRVDGVVVCSALTDGGGAFSCSQPSANALSAGPHVVTITATDAAGNTSAPTANRTFTVVGATPTPAITSPADGATTSPRPTVTGTAPAGVATVEVTFDGVPYCLATVSGGTWSCTAPTTAPPLTSGSHTVRAIGLSGTGVASPPTPTRTITVDATPPAAPVVTAPANGSTTNNPRPTLAGTAEPNSTVEVRVDGAVVCASVTVSAGGTWSCTPASNLADGTRQVTARATDGVGNQGPASTPSSFTIDTAAPPAPAITAPVNNTVTSNQTPTISGTAEANSIVTVFADGMPVCTNVMTSAGGTFTCTPSTPLAEGTRVLTARATDAAGNQGPPSAPVNVIIDRTAPVAPVVTAPANGSVTNATRPTLSGTAEAGSTVEVRVDGQVVCASVTVAMNGSWSCQPASPLMEGQRSVTARATDAAGNQSPVSNTNVFTIDATAPMPPVISAPTSGSTVSPTPTISGTAEANSIVTVRADGSVICANVMVSATGAWSCTPSMALMSGTRVLSATSTDAATNVSLPSMNVSVSVDGTPPPAPTITAPSNGATTSATPTISGTAEANSIVTVFADGMPVCTNVMTSATGTFTCMPSTPLAEGTRVLTARATDAAGNQGPPSAPVNVIIDRTAPVAPVVTAPANGSVTNATRPTLSGTAEAGSTVEVRVDGQVVCASVTVAVNGSWSCQPATALMEGQRSVTARATDAAGNQSPVSNTNVFTIDATAPMPPVISAPTSGSTVSPTPSISGTAEANSVVTVRADGSVICANVMVSATGAWSCTPSMALMSGTRVLSATSTDAATNVSLPSMNVSVSVDGTPPPAPTITAPSNGATTSATPTITGTAEASSTVTVLIDGMVAGTAMANAQGAWTFTPTTPLSSGAHTVAARATDTAGNTGPTTPVVNFTVQAGPPATPTVTFTSPTRDSTPTFSGTGAPGSTVTVFVDGVSVCTATVSTQGTWSCDPTTPLADGTRSVQVNASNGAGTSPLSTPQPLVIDTLAPLTPVVVGPANGSSTTDTTPTLTGTGEPGSTVTLRIDGMAVGTTTVQANGTFSFDVPSALTLGTHTVSATAVDAAGNTSLPSNTNTFTVVMPGAPVVTTPGDNSAVSSGTPTLSGTAPAGSTVFVRVDGVVACTTTATATGTFSCTPSMPLSDGPHTVNAVARENGVDSPVSNTTTFTVDTRAPLAPTVTSPADGSSTTNTRPTYTGTAEPLSTVEVFVDGMSVGTTEVPANGQWTLTPTTALSTGMHSVTALATDRAGNVSPSSTANGFTVVAVTPNAPVVTGPLDGAITNQNRPVLAGTAAAGSTVDVRIDGVTVCAGVTVRGDGTWDCRPSMPVADGRRAVSAVPAGQMGPVSNTNVFTIDTAAPMAPTVSSPRDGSFASATPTITGTAEPGSRVTVSVDGQPVCTVLADAQGAFSCTPATPLMPGMHTVNAVATDPAGNPSMPSATNRFTVDTMAPAAPTLTSPADDSRTMDSTPDYVGTAEPDSRVTITVDGQPVCTTQANSMGAFTCTPTVPLSAGPHTATATATDAAGNRSMPSAANTFTVTIAPPSITAPADGSTTRETSPMISGTALPNASVTVREGATVICTTMANAQGAFSCSPMAPFSEGPHVLTATQTVGTTTSDASAPTRFTVDRTGPTVMIGERPPSSSTTPTATFTFSSNDPTATFECRLDGGAFMACSSPTTFSDLPPGRHTVEVRAKDPSGNTSMVETYEWDVVGQQPERKTLYAGGGISCSSAGGGLLWLGALVMLRRRRR